MLTTFTCPCGKQIESKDFERVVCSCGKIFEFNGINEEELIEVTSLDEKKRKKPLDMFTVFGEKNGQR